MLFKKINVLCIMLFVLNNLYTQCTSTTTAPSFSLHHIGTGLPCDCIGTGPLTRDITTLGSTILAGDSADITFTPSLTRCGACGFSVQFTLKEVPSGNVIGTVGGSPCFTTASTSLTCSPTSFTVSFRASANVTGIQYELTLFSAAAACSYSGPMNVCIGGGIGPSSVCVYSASPCGACPSGGSGTTHTWTGCQDTDWFNACNWDRQTVPTTTSNVIIPNTTNKPQINGGTANCYDITLQSSLGARLDITSTGFLNITSP